MGLDSSDEPDSVLALRGRFHLELARELHRTALNHAAQAPVAPPRKTRRTRRKRAL